MKGRRLARFLLGFLGAATALAAVAVLDWYPTLKNLGSLRRERGDLERKIRDYRAAAAAFRFPDADEEALLAASEAELRQALPLVENDDAWMGLAHTELLEREKGVAGLISVFTHAEAFAPGLPGLTAWLKLQGQEIHRSLDAADPWRRYPWRGLIPPGPATGKWLACRPLGIALDAPLPVLLDFVNRVSWGAVRLEIVRLRLEPVGESARAWLVCRGSYWVTTPSFYLAGMEPGDGGEQLLIDADSTLLLQPVDPLFVPVAGMRELPPAGSPW